MSNERDKVMGTASETISIKFTEVDNAQSAFNKHQQALQKGRDQLTSSLASHKNKIPEQYRDTLTVKFTETLNDSADSINEYIDLLIQGDTELSLSQQKMLSIERLIQSLLSTFSEFMTEISELYNIYDSDTKPQFKANLTSAIKNLKIKPNLTVSDVIKNFITSLNSLYKGLQQEFTKINTTTETSIKDILPIKNAIKSYAIILTTITKNLDAQIDALESSSVTNARRSEYEYKNIDYLDYIKWCLFVVYIILVLLYCAFGPFVRNEEYNTYIGWAKTLSLIISAFIPFYIAWFIEIVYNFIVKMFDSVIGTRVYSINQNDSPLKLKNTMSQKIITNTDNVLQIPVINSPFNH